MNRREHRAELAMMRAVLPEEKRQERIRKAVAMLREELLGLATVEVTVPQANVLVITVRGLDGEVLASLPAQRPGLPVTSLGLIR